MTSSLPCRRTSLQFSQIRLMLARTFMTQLPPKRIGLGEIVFITGAAKTGKGGTNSNATPRPGKEKLIDDSPRIQPPRYRLTGLRWARTFRARQNAVRGDCDGQVRVWGGCGRGAAGGVGGGAGGREGSAEQGRKCGRPDGR